MLANDPDADRLAVAEKRADGEWKVFSGDEIAQLLSHWMFVNYQKSDKAKNGGKLAMVNSTVSSKALQALADAEGFVAIDTLTGW